MEQSVFKVIRVYRNNFTRLVDGLSAAEFNKVPEGFSNNIIWNYGHVIVSQQILCYRFTGDLRIDNTLVEKYRRGTRPEAFISLDEFLLLKELGVKVIDDMERDFATDVFAGFEEYTTSSGSTISDIRDAIAYVAAHDALHYGYALAQKRALVC